MYQPKGYYVIRGRFTWAQLEEILGKSEYGLQYERKASDCQPCGLTSARPLTYRIYADWVDGIGTRSAHVVLHPDGICFSGSLRVEHDWAFAKELWVKVMARFEKYQEVVAEIRNG